MNTKSLLALPVLAAVLLLSARSQADEDAKTIRIQKVYYPLTTCLMAGEPLAAEAVDLLHEGRLVRFCCEKCAEKFKAAPADPLKALDAAVVKAQSAGYAVTTCVVSGEALGGMGEPVDHVALNRLVRFCCKSCVKPFTADAPAMLAKLDEALIAAKLPAYPLATCVVSDEALGAMGKPVDKVYGVDVVRFCCKSCVKSFEKDPQGFLTKIRAAPAKPTERAGL